MHDQLSLSLFLFLPLSLSLTDVQEKGEFTADLFELHEAHRRGLGFESEWLRGSWSGFSFYTNCEIARVDFWTQPLVKEYLQRIDEAVCVCVCVRARACVWYDV